MAGDKIDISFEINTDSEKLLEQIVEKYDLPDMGKAIRCLIDYAIDDGSLEVDIFKLERCHSCD